MHALAKATGLLLAIALISSASTASAKETPWLGVLIADDPNGALLGPLIMEVIPGTPADDAGMVAGDVVTHVGSQRVATAHALVMHVTSLEVGSQTRVKVIRNSVAVDLEATLSPKLSDDETLKRRLIDSKMPPFALPVLTGNLSGASIDHANDVILLLFVDPVCQGDCAKLMRSVDGMRVFYEKDGLAALGVMPSNASTPVARKLNASERLGMTILRDGYSDDLRVTALKSNALPTLIVVDRRGFIRYAAMGAAIDVKDVRFAVSRALGRTASR